MYWGYLVANIIVDLNMRTTWYRIVLQEIAWNIKCATKFRSSGSKKNATRGLSTQNDANVALGDHMQLFCWRSLHQQLFVSPPKLLAKQWGQALLRCRFLEGKQELRASSALQRWNILICIDGIDECTCCMFTYPYLQFFCGSRHSTPTRWYFWFILSYLT